MSLIKIHQIVFTRQVSDDELPMDDAFRAALDAEIIPAAEAIFGGEDTIGFITNTFTPSPGFGQSYQLVIKVDRKKDTE